MEGSGDSQLNARRLLVRWIASALLVLLVGCQEKPDTETVYVYAAASLADAVQEIGREFEEETGYEMVYNFAGSNVLAQQIAASSQADVFISADPDWMAFAEASGKIASESRIDLVANRLVAIGSSRSSSGTVSQRDWCALDFKFLCIGDPESVPVGKYAKAWLEGIECGGSSAWEAVQKRMLPSSDARAVLAQTLSVANAVGIVYFSDYLSAKDDARILVESDSVVARYPGALTRVGLEKRAAGRFYLFVQGEESQKVFRSHGFDAALNE